MLTASPYYVNGAPQSCTGCGGAFREVDGHRVAVHTAHGYFCSSPCAEQRAAALTDLKHRRAS